jgi:hypothetical protein
MVKPTRSIGFSLFFHIKREKKIGGFFRIYFSSQWIFGSHPHRRGGLFFVWAQTGTLYNNLKRRGGRRASLMRVHHLLITFI